jgi:hypothetical protein
MAKKKTKKNKAKVKDLKAKLSKGELSKAQRQKAAKQIKNLGGKVSLSNFPKKPDKKKETPKKQQKKTTKKTTPPKKTTTSKANPNKTRIQQLKARLQAGGLSASQINSIVSQIRSLGGAVNTANIPAPVRGTVTPSKGKGTTSSTTTKTTSTGNKKDNKEEIERLKARLAAGNLTQSQINKISNKISALGGKVNTDNFPVAGSADPNPDAKRDKSEAGGGSTGSDDSEADPISGDVNDPNSAAARAQAELEQGLEFGEDLAQRFFAEGTLDRLDTVRTSEQQEVIDRRRALLGGLTDEEIRGIKESGQRDIGVQVAQARRNVISRLAQTGARGNAAAAALGDVERQRLVLQSGLTQDILNRNIDLRRQALTNFETTVNNQAAFEREGQVFNAEQQAAEVAGRAGATAQGIGLSTGLSSAIRAEDFAQQQLTFQKQEAKRNRKQQLKLLNKQLEQQRDLFNQSRADATGGF